MTRRLPADPRLPAALDLIAIGRAVFVLGRTKRPVANCPACHSTKDGPAHDPQACTCLTCHGFYAATKDHTHIAAMLTAVPDGLLAVRTGTPSGLVVVDIDPHHGGQLDRNLMTPTATVATGGGGWHLYYTHPGHTVRSRPLPSRPGIDIKGDGGYVVTPPSVHPTTGHPYRWIGRRPVAEMPPTLIDAIRTPAPPTIRTPLTEPTRRENRGAISNPAALIAATLAAVDRAPEGRRRTTLYGAARGLARLVDTGHLTPAAAVAALTDCGQRNGQNPRQIHAAITGGFTAEGLGL
ncbi:bifunctional DNA primase/polymerase [Frankia sp. Cj3]|uniref:bifunctional DNA primase/polymerase n=1 Tax=Frankia sp. Cj3 TaxID=2880976 RepID=UPI001EF40E62|nr:bifunctional DNA primase/polymerase [Frankia sp. Cj3]